MVRGLNLHSTILDLNIEERADPIEKPHLHSTILDLNSTHNYT